ncbi:MAG TPA: hypothetical protein VJZ91_17310, partial [Blastocatellia bacterium]|nr:hypothetical protein [Blastocatellia bacterium]
MKRCIAYAFCVLAIGLCLAATRPEAPAVAKETGEWLLKQSRARSSGGAIDEAAAPPAVKTARPTTLFITTFQRGHVSRPLAGSG